MAGKGDVEAFPEAVNDAQDETIKERSMRILSRTKSAATFGHYEHLVGSNAFKRVDAQSAPF